MFLRELIIVLIFGFVIASEHNKYSAGANVKSDILSESGNYFRTLQKPFRMAKLNMLWSKAQLRLTEPKLKSLYSELKIHDKEELVWKKMKADGLDKDGLEEAKMRKRLIGIMSTYGLLEHFEDINDPKQYKQHKAFNEASEDYINKSLFKDKKLNKLWEKAEKAGFTAEELQALKEEFGHHQDKIDQYYSLLHEVKEGMAADDTDSNSVDNTLDRFNALEEQEEPAKDHRHKANMLRERHRDIRDGYDRLHRIAAKGPNSKEFVEPKVQGLWQMALNGNFSTDELESLRVELMHYENRLLKLRHLQAEAALGAGHRATKPAGEKPTTLEDLEDSIKKHARKADKLHAHLESKIINKHLELYQLQLKRMTSILLSEWLLSLDKEMSMKNKKIALLIDNCSAHNKNCSAHNKQPALNNIELRYFPPNCTSILQPLDMGIIKNLKTKYHSCLVQHMITNIERKVSNPYSFNVKQACDVIASSQNCVQPNVIVNCLKNARISESEDVGENVVMDEITQDDNQSDLEIYSAVTSKGIDASVVENLSVDDEAFMFEAYTDESTICKLKGNLPGEDSEDDSDVISVNPPPLMELIGQFETISN